VADVGSGTGLLARELLRRRYVVIAIEPNAAMRAMADALLSNCPNYCSIAASAEATSLADGSVDLVAAAQAFHWFDVAAVRREWLRILAPNGRVALIWNTRPLDDPLQQAVDDVLGEFGGVRHDALTAQQQLSTVAPFFAGAPYEQFEVPHSQPLERAGFVSLVLSRSTMPDRDTPAGRRAEQVIFSLFDRYVTNAAVTVNYRTVAFLGRPAAAR